MSREVREVVAIVVRRSDRPDHILAVQRPDDDEDLPGVWGLPAGRRQADENVMQAARRAGREKLGVELEVGKELAQGRAERPAYSLVMHLIEASIRAGEPSVPQPFPGITQYQAWRWAEADLFEPGAGKGSLCCRLFLGQLERGRE